MSSLSIDKNLDPNKKITFRVEMSFFGYGKNMEFDFDTPNAAPLLSRIENITLKNEKGADREKTKGNYGFSKYSKGGDIGGGFYKLKILLNSAKQANQLEPGETINFVSSDSKLAQLNNKNFQIIKDTNKDARYVYLRVSNSFQPTQANGSASGSLQEITGSIKTRKYTVSIPKEVLDGLVTELLPGPKKGGMMEDIPIFAYKRFKGNNSAGVKRKLMVNDNEVNDKNPPDRDTVIKYRGQKSYSTNFDINDKENFIFYVAIARYIYNGETWKKEWVQTNSSDEAIWGKAKEGGKN
jgi:hypothetical protein